MRYDRDDVADAKLSELKLFSWWQWIKGGYLYIGYIG